MADETTADRTTLVVELATFGLETFLALAWRSEGTLRDVCQPSGQDIKLTKQQAVENKST